jgi:hypothetical protein
MISIFNYLPALPMFSMANIRDDDFPGWGRCEGMPI